MCPSRTPCQRGSPQHDEHHATQAAHDADTELRDAVGRGTIALAYRPAEASARLISAPRSGSATTSRPVGVSRISLTPRPRRVCAARALSPTTISKYDPPPRVTSARVPLAMSFPFLI